MGKTIALPDFKEIAHCGGRFVVETKTDSAGNRSFRCGIEHSKKIIDLLALTGAKIVLDVVPHNIYQRINLAEFRHIIGRHVDMAITEYRTLLGLSNVSPGTSEPEEKELTAAASKLKIRYLVIRYGEGNADKQTICVKAEKDSCEIIESKETGYTELEPMERIGFGDRLTADLLDRHYTEIRGKI